MISMYDRLMTSGQIEPRWLYGVAEIADLLQVGRTTVSNWYEARHKTSFPETVHRVASGPLWDVRAVVGWYQFGYRPIKGHKAGVMPEGNAVTGWHRAGVDTP
jgi:hypothetical protein